MKKQHYKLGAYHRVADHLYRYSATLKYYAVFKLHGKTKWVSLETTDRELASRRVREEIEKYKKTDPKTSTMALNALLDLYEKSIQGLAEHTQATRKSILKVFKETWDEGLETQVRNITKGQLQLWLSKHRARLKNSSYNEYIRFVRHLFGLAIDHKVIAESPIASMKLVRVEKPIRPTPTWEQLEAIVADIRKQKFNADAQETGDLVEFMGKAGVGTAECANLSGENFDLSKGKIILYRKKTDTGYSIPVFPQLKPLLKNFTERGKIESGKPVFRIKDPKKALDAACKRLSFQHFSSRALRRCFITRAIELGVDFKTIAGWQGHQDGGVLIAKTYSHLRNEHSENMAKKLVA